MPTNPGPQPAARTVAALEHQRAAFRAKFGRDPGPDDPLFFDPDADEPRPLTVEQLAQGFDDVIAAVTDAGMDPAFIKAWQELGYIVGTENRHLFTEAEVNTFEEAVLRHRDTSTEQDAAPPGPAPPDVDAAPPGVDAGPQQAPTLADVVRSLSDSFEGVVDATLRDPRSEPAMNVTKRLRDSVTGDAADELVAATAFAVLTGWLSGAREQGVDPDPVMAWVQQHLGEQVAPTVRPVSGLIGYADAPRISIQAAADQLGPALVPALLWLACGIAATAGSGDAGWLRQFDLDEL